MLTQFGNYLLDEEIAIGGMARVFRARLRGLGGFEKPLVVKQVLPELAKDSRFVEMFVREANTLVQMNHPHIVSVYELGVVDGTYFLAMEYVEGATLSRLLRSEPLQPASVAQVGLQVCDALQYAHERFQILHRDVTPRNLIVDGAGHVHLLDFGIATGRDSDHSERFGSPGYMSPEQSRGETLSPASDLFSLGAVLFEALVGRPAFLRDTREQTRAALLEGPIPRLADEASVPAELASLLDPLLERSAGDRPQSAQQLGRRLRAWLSAHHPEGAFAELGERANRAGQRRDRPAGTPAPATQIGDDPPEVKTLAAAPDLVVALEKARSAGGVPLPTGEVSAGTQPVVGRPAPSPPSSAPTSDGDAAQIMGTRPISGRPPPMEAPGTRPLSNRPPPMEPLDTRPITGRPPPPLSPIDTRPITGRPPPPAPAEVIDSSQPPASEDITTSRPPPARRPLAGWIVALLAVAGLGWVLRNRPLLDPPPAVAPGPTATRAPEPAPTPAPEPKPAPEPPAVPPSEPTPAPAEPVVKAPPKPAAVGKGQLSINAIPWADVSVDGKPQGSTPKRNISVSAGPHTVKLSCPPLGKTARVPVRVADGKHVRIVVDLQADPVVVNKGVR